MKSVLFFRIIQVGLCEYLLFLLVGQNKTLKYGIMGDCNGHYSLFFMPFCS